MFHNKTIYRETAISSGNIAMTIKILSFSDLPRGWHYGSGELISRDVIFAALIVASKLTNAGTLRIEAFPNVSGAVLVSGYKDDETVDIMCRPNGIYSLFHENGDKEPFDEDNLSLTYISNYVQALQWRQSNSSDSYILSTTVMNLAGSKARPLNFQTMGFQSSMQDVVWPQAGTSAITSANSTNQLYQEVPQYFYDSQLMNYQQAQL